MIGLVPVHVQGANDIFAGTQDSGPGCSPAYAPQAADSAISVAKLWRQKCPQTEIIMRGLSILVGNGGSTGHGVWPSPLTVVCELELGRYATGRCVLALGNNFDIFAAGS